METMVNAENFLLFPQSGEGADVPVTSSFQTMLVTPDIAYEWLKRNVKNRPKKPKLIEQYARSMQLGLWRLTGESIKFDWNGNLLDGQNRLYAICKAGVDIMTDVRFGLDPLVFENLDSGKVRTLADVLGLKGERHAASLAAALAAVWAYLARRYSQLANGLSHEEGLVVLHEHPRLRLSVEPGFQARKLLTPKLSISFHYLCARHNKDQADFFWQRLATGENLSVGNPIYLLRERLMMERGNRVKTQVKVVETAALVIKAWNAFSLGHTIKQLKWASHANPPEAFPRLAQDPVLINKEEGV